jgi:hypothetical protein
VKFDTRQAGVDEENRRTPYVLLSRCFEFPGPATIEWHDGLDYDGGGEIVSITLSKARVFMKLDRAMDFDVSFQISDRKFAQLSTYLKRMLDQRIHSEE